MPFVPSSYILLIIYHFIIHTSLQAILAPPEKVKTNRSTPRSNPFFTVASVGYGTLSCFRLTKECSLNLSDQELRYLS